MNIVEYLSTRSKASLMTAGLFFILLLGILDYFTGYELSLSIFYLLPIVLVAWFAGRELGFVVAVLAAAAWYLAEFAWGIRYLHPAILYWNMLVRLGFFLITVYLVSSLKGMSGQLSKLLEERTAELKVEAAGRKLAAKDVIRKSMLLDAVADSVIVHDLKGNILYANEAACRFRGFSRDDMLRKNMRELNTPEYAEFFGTRIKDVLEKGEMTFESAQFRRDGSSIPIDVHACIVDWDGEKVVLRLGRDISARKRMEEEVRRLATVVRDSNDTITIQDKEGRITAWNRGAEQMFGYSKQEALQMKIWQLAPPNKAEEQKDFNRRIFAGENVGSFETQRLTKDGRLIDVWLTVTKLVDNAGKVNAIAATERDITERKRSAVERERLLRALSERVKEMKCLNEIARLTERPGMSVDELAQGVVKLLPSAWQYPEITCARIMLDSKESKTENFKETKWRQSAVIKVDNKRFGEITVCYLEERPPAGEGPFLREERDILETIADYLGHVIQHRLTEGEIKRRLEELEIFHKATVGRELKMIELEKEVNSLLKVLGKDPKYRERA